MRTSDEREKRRKELSSKDRNLNRNNLSGVRSTERNRERNRERNTSNYSNRDKLKQDDSYTKIGSNADKRRREYEVKAKSSSKGKVVSNPSNSLPSKNQEKVKRVKKTKKSQRDTVVATVGNVDAILVTVIYILVFFGIVMIYSASNYNARHNFGNPYHFASRQLMIAIAGLVIMHILSTVDIFEYTFLSKNKLPYIIFITSIVLLIAVIFVGTTANGQSRWLYIPGTKIGMQPSEAAKHALIIFLAYYLSVNQHRLKSFKFYLQVIGIIAIPTGLTIISNLSTGIILFVIGVGMVFIASPYFARLVAVGAAGAAACAGILLTYLKFNTDYHNARFLAWQDPFAYAQSIGFQTVQSLLAIGSGGAFGLGIGKGRQKLYYIPESHNDIIFAVICEELGFVGATLLLLIFCILFWRGIKIAINAKDMFGTLIASGVTIMLAVQTIINVSVTTNTIPNTGIALPFISYGGTSILFLLIMMGVVLSISRYSRFND
ncbi:MAG: FtsW/RodA/SpoVE family cell cycle protein [Lachnospirales bacterium]